ncbi:MULTISPECIES: DUF2790 domain-containing protein [unclassified Pseudomonas]|uniref:DUF2790 domain-containing protein n=1 Tax=unclassified Pseudomonas TaxID=196821 RepID=UPI000C86DD7B|nr:MULTISPECIES: DUF2790 domain-containing protein [unclassified Pseudomonas]PMV21075.1 DUF2790 domain-containing protein [Pseudomonas sp. FW305-3-2-15-C-TSA2]PMV26356.1 DUF2790 domain-containing protein [Pseudomonas sp. DP16D-L5]PMV37409.1 DUF2790 domain-containing protein [Pseudomonas sp. FW305-3-2-15-A-LB2]PMV43643.1 DUF2790 domain-containing protein [Pseudomonas sp. FW305-3-2-15-C-R2A1]PMV48606.1 DUF2790 domain-containing protein [Pseudomonas sp. FW305-3-2-15-C-LB1]
MKLRTLMLGATLALAAASGLAQADDQTVAVKPVPYHYGLPMNIDKVLAMNETPTDECKVIKADIKFLDKAGKVEDVSYRKMSEACDFQN